MLYLVRVEVRIPDQAEPEIVEAVRAREIARAHELQRSGKMTAIWRLPGRRANVAIFDVADHDELHHILSTLPTFQWLDIQVEALAAHPARLA